MLVSCNELANKGFDSGFFFVSISGVRCLFVIYTKASMQLNCVFATLAPSYYSCNCFFVNIAFVLYCLFMKLYQDAYIEVETLMKFDTSVKLFLLRLVPTPPVSFLYKRKYNSIDGLID